MDGHTAGVPQGPGGQNPAYRPAHRHHDLAVSAKPPPVTPSLRTMKVNGNEIAAGADLAGADLTDSDLRNVDLTGAVAGGRLC